MPHKEVTLTTYITAPLGVQAAKNFAVLCLLNVDDCICKSLDISINTSLPSIIVYTLWGIYH